MKLKKKILSLSLSLGVLFASGTFSMAKTFSDVSQNYWAYNQINTLSCQNVVSGYPDGTFKPEGLVTRSEFVKMMISALNQDKLAINVENNFTDINADSWAYNSVLRSKQLGLVVGYPDNTFRPNFDISKTEVTSIVGNTLNANSCCIEEAVNNLGKFEDKNNIEAWAVNSFARAVENDLYVNYPQADLLTPNKKVTRAEVAVLLAKLREKNELISEKYKGPNLHKVTEKLKVEVNKTVIEHLNSPAKYTGSKEVEITGLQAKIIANNVIPVNFERNFDSQNIALGESVYFVVEQDIATQEGTVLIPAGSRVKASVSELYGNKLFHRNAKVALSFDALTLVTGETYAIKGSIADNNGVLKNKLGMCNLKKFGTYALAGSALGATSGVAIGGMASEAGDGAILGTIIGGGIGFVTGVTAKGCPVVKESGSSLYLQLEESVLLNLRK